MNAQHDCPFYPFWHIVARWTPQRFEDDRAIARKLAYAVLRDGLPLHSAEPASAAPDDLQTRNGPLIHFRAHESAASSMIRLPALLHLRAIIERAAAPDVTALSQEFFRHDELVDWAERHRVKPRQFWFATPSAEGCQP